MSNPSGPSTLNPTDEKDGFYSGVETSIPAIKVSSEFIPFRHDESDISVTDATQGNVQKSHAKSQSSNINIKREDYDRISQSSLNSINSRTTSPQKIHRKQALLEKTDLEFWWLDSPKWRRFLPFMCATIFAIGFCQLVAGLYFFIAVSNDIPKDPYVCQTESCKSIGDFIELGLKESIDPCDNFFEFVCGNLKEDHGGPLTAPSKVELGFARLEFNKKSLLGSILRKDADKHKKIIPFYKSCIDIGLRAKDDLGNLVNISYEILKPAFRDIDHFDTVKLTTTVARITGQFGMFRIKYLPHNMSTRTVVLLPPRSSFEFDDFDINDDKNPRTQEFKTYLTRVYTILWKEFQKLDNNSTKSNPLGMTAKKAVDYAMIVLRAVHKARLGREAGPHKGDLEHQERGLKEVRSLLDYFLFDKKSDEMTETENYTIISSNVRDKIFEVGDIEDQILSVRRAVSNGNEAITRESRQAFVSFWIYNLLWLLAPHVEPKVYKKLRLGKVFPDSRDKRNVSAEIFCFETLVRKLGPLVIESFLLQNKKVHKQNSEWLDEIFHRTYRAHSNIFRSVNTNFLYPDQAFISKAFSLIQAGVFPVNPYPQFPNQKALLSEMRTIYDQFKPFEDYLYNVLAMRHMFVYGVLNLWRNYSYDEEFSMSLEVMDQSTNDELFYQNKMFLPLATLDLPYIGNDIRVLDHAGSGLLMAKSLLRLWLMDREEPRALLREDRPEELDRYKHIPKYRPIKRHYQTCGNFPSSQPSRKNLSDLIKSHLTNALAFKLAFEVYKNPKQYESFVSKRNNVMEERIRFVYNQNDDEDPQPKYYKIGSGHDHDEHNLINASYINLPPTEEDISKYNRYSSLHAKYRRNFAKLSGKLSKFTSDQLFFITAVRHRCYEISKKSAEYMMEMNAVLSKVEEFGEVFNCPLGSPMNKIEKCI